MADYIKREDAINACFVGWAACHKVNCNGLKISFDTQEILERVPAADVRPVVFCENCIYLTNGTCRIPFLKSDESYCSWGRDYREVPNDGNNH